MKRRARGDLIGRQPQRAQDAVVQGAVRVVRAELAAEGEAAGRSSPRRPSARRATGRRRPAASREGEGGLLERLARRRGEQALARVEVARRLVQRTPSAVSSSTSRKRPSRSMTAATVTDGFQGSAMFQEGARMRR